MTGILTAVVVVVGVVAAADLLLSFAIIRRLAHVEERGGGRAGGNHGSPAIGHQVGEFRAELLSGGDFTRAGLAGTRALVVFMMTGCEPCKRVLAELRELPAPLPFPLYILITVTQRDSDALGMTAGLPEGAHIGVVSADDAVTRAFAIDGYPTTLDVEDGVVRAVELQLSKVLEHAGQR
jgi:hypothetical protein